MKLQKFDGGLNTRQEPHLIGIDEGQVYTNIDNESGALKPVTAPLAAGESYNNKHRYIKYSKSMVELGKVPIDFLEYKNKIYYSVQDDFVQIKDSESEGDLGLNIPAIFSSEVAAVRPNAPVSADITVNEARGYTLPHTGQDPSWSATTMAGTFKDGVTYQMAFQQVSPNGGISDIFYYNYTVSGVVSFDVLGNQYGCWPISFGISLYIICVNTLSFGIS